MKAETKIMPLKVAAREEKTGKKNKWDHIEDWLRENHPTRMNSVTMRLEYWCKHSESWHTMSDYELNSLVRDLRNKTYPVVGKNKETGEDEITSKSMACAKMNLMNILESDFNERVDVFHEYFESLPLNEMVPQKRYNINKLANSIVIKDPEKLEDLEDGEKPAVKPSELWEKYLTKWLVAAVANFFDEYECQNQTMLVLVGSQNDGKTTWLNNLVPPRFNPKYRFCSGIGDPRGKDAMTLLVSMFIVNIDDQLGSINKKDADGIKNLITMPRVTIRLPYDKFVVDHNHRASLVASLNHTSFLSDPTGNRRYLPFEINGVKWDYLNPDKPDFVDIDAVWAEAYWIYLNQQKLKFNFKFKGDELEELNQHNQAFKIATTEEDLIKRWIIQPQKGADARKIVGAWFLTTTEVECYLRAMSTGGVNHQSVRPLSLERIKRVMTAEGFEYKQRRLHDESGRNTRAWVWAILKVPINNDSGPDGIYGRQFREI
jgi:hypothetical protein